MSLQIELLEEIFNDIEPYGNQFVSKFYENLFKADPETKSLFTSIEPETRNKKVWHDLVLVFENLRQPATLKNILRELGAKLDSYGALPEHYSQIKDALSTTFAQFLGSQWTTEIEQAWNEAYLYFREVMLEGAAEAQRETQKPMAGTSPVLASEKTFEETAAPTLKEVLEESLEEESEETPTTESTATPPEKVVLDETNNYLKEEAEETPETESAATEPEELAFAETDHSSTEEIGSNSPEESVNIVEEGVIIEDSTDNSPEKTTMPESNDNIPQEDIRLEQSQSQDSSEEKVSADLSENLRSQNIDPQFTQIFNPESTASASATAVKPVASEKTYKPENQASKSNKKLLVGGFAGIAGIIWLLIILL